MLEKQIQDITLFLFLVSTGGSVTNKASQSRKWFCPLLYTTAMNVLTWLALSCRNCLMLGTIELLYWASKYVASTLTPSPSILAKPDITLQSEERI